MKKAFALLPALVLLLALTACGDKPAADDHDTGKAQSNNSGDISDKAPEEAENALMKLGAQLPDGWTDGSYWMMKDGWDTDFLPAVLPAPAGMMKTIWASPSP